MLQRKKSIASGHTQPYQIEFEISCYVNSPDSKRRSSLLEETFQPKRFKIEIAFCREKDYGTMAQTTSLCRECKGVLFREFSQRLSCTIGDDQVEFLLKHELRDRQSSFRVIALLGGSYKECILPREEDTCPLCKFAFSPFDRACSRSEQSLSRYVDLRASPYFSPKQKKDYLTGEAPFATEVNPQGEMVQKKSKPSSARPNYVSGTDLELKSREGTGLHRHVSVHLSKIKPCPVCYAHRTKPSDSRRRVASFAEDDSFKTLKREVFMSPTKLQDSPDFCKVTTLQNSPYNYKNCRVM
ncbi:hypothetical protein LOD99_1148 [Oopsacas minuta]|uniref:Uncharacterized protein n=1 Tax=Oopsacas minuta TaxID=111878 RepID=A0AAV7K6L5_9METZ|nr:hypothetical protein LOD99_1148 [Oopsacas minuta]